MIFVLEIGLDLKHFRSHGCPINFEPELGVFGINHQSNASYYVAFRICSDVHCCRRSEINVFISPVWHYKHFSYIQQSWSEIG